MIKKCRSFYMRIIWSENKLQTMYHELELACVTNTKRADILIGSMRVFEAKPQLRLYRFRTTFFTIIRIIEDCLQRLHLVLWVRAAIFNFFHKRKRCYTRVHIS